MTIIRTRTSSFETRLQDSGVTMLLLSDEDDDVAERIHDVAANVLKSGQFVFLLRNVAILTSAEQQRWFAEGGHYAVIGGTDRVVAVRGTLDEFMLSDGSVSRIEIRFAMARGDKLP